MTHIPATREEPAVLPVDGGNVYCRTCHSGMLADASYCNQCGTPRLVDAPTVAAPMVRQRETVLTDGPPVRTVSDTWSGPFFVLGLLGILLIAAVLWFAFRPDRTGSTPPATTVVSQTVPAPVVVPPAPQTVVSVVTVPVPTQQQVPAQSSTTANTTASTTSTTATSVP